MMKACSRSAVDGTWRQPSSPVPCATTRRVIAHVGDSRCYQVRDGKANLLTRDHTWVSEQRKLGLITRPPRRNVRRSRHVLTRSLGPELFVTVETGSVSLKPGDVLVLCTDGLYGGNVSRRHRAHRVAEQGRSDHRAGIGQLCRGSRWLRQCNRQVIQVRSIEPMGKYRGRLYPLPVQP